MLLRNWKNLTNGQRWFGPRRLSVNRSPSSITQRIRSPLIPARLKDRDLGKDRGPSLRYLWIGFGWLFVGLGVIGIALPLLPTTPFLLLAALCFSRGSEKIHSWLLNHPTLGPPIHDWQTNRAISRRSKVVASLSMIALLIVTPLVGAPLWAAALQGAVLCVVATFLWTRREP